ncbi:MAG: alpha/beta hydrolase [Planctomycetaceae bacterium]
MLTPANRDVGPPPDGLKTEEFQLTSASGATIAGWFITAPDTNGANATIVLFHGIRGSRGSMVSRAHLLHAAGFAVVMIDLQAHGESSGEFISVGHLERHDVEAAVAFARERTPDHRIAVIGQSLGGASTLMADNLNLDAIVLEAVFPTLREAIFNRVSEKFGPLSHIPAWSLLAQFPIRLGFSANEIQPIQRLPAMRCPTQILCGSVDPHTPLTESRAMFEAACEPKQLVIFEGAGHTDFLKYDEALYSREVIGFLTKHLVD